MADRYSFEQFQQDCAALGPIVGALTGEIYGHGASTISLGAVGSEAVDQIIGGFVAENWQHSCALPGAIAEAIGPQQSPTIDSGPPAADQSISID